MSEEMKPGATALQVMLRALYSRATDLVSPITPACTQHAGVSASASAAGQSKRGQNDAAARLGGCVVGLPGVAKQAHHGRDVDDAPGLALAHQLARLLRAGRARARQRQGMAEACRCAAARLRAVEDAGQVGVDHLLPLLRLHAHEQRVAGDAWGAHGTVSACVGRSRPGARRLRAAPALFTRMSTLPYLATVSLKSLATSSRCGVARGGVSPKSAARALGATIRKAHAAQRAATRLGDVAADGHRVTASLLHLGHHLLRAGRARSVVDHHLRAATGKSALSRGRPGACRAAHAP